MSELKLPKFDCSQIDEYIKDAEHYKEMQLYDGDGFRIKCEGESMRFKCCGCGLTHVFTFTVNNDGEKIMTITRSEE